MVGKSREERGAATRMGGDFYACFTCFFFAKIICEFSQNLSFSLFFLHCNVSFLYLFSNFSPVLSFFCVLTPSLALFFSDPPSSCACCERVFIVKIMHAACVLWRVLQRAVG